MPDVTFIKRKTLEAADVYTHSIKGVIPPAMGSVTAKKLDKTVPPVSKKEVFGHLLWLCEEIKRAAEAENFGTCRDYMSFINGVLWYMSGKLSEVE